MRFSTITPPSRSMTDTRRSVVVSGLLASYRAIDAVEFEVILGVIGAGLISDTAMGAMFVEESRYLLVPDGKKAVLAKDENTETHNRWPTGTPCTSAKTTWIAANNNDHVGLLKWVSLPTESDNAYCEQSSHRKRF